ncbi:hypothetical protein ACYOEI_20215, partial [Singulisphaera rosea]
MSTLIDSIPGRAPYLERDDPVDIDSLLPPALESDERWFLRRAATEVLQDEGLRFIRIGSTLLAEPMAGQRPNPTAGATIVEGTIRDVLTGGRADPLP